MLSLNLLSHIPKDSDPRATYTETPERQRLRSVLVLAVAAMELPAPVATLSQKLLARLSDAQCLDACQRAGAVATYLYTGEAPPLQDERAPSAQQEIAVVEAPAPAAPRRSMRELFG